MENTPLQNAGDQAPASQKERGLGKLTNYVRELSIVIVGIAVTLLAGNFIGHLKDKNTVKGYLADVKKELEYNLTELEDKAHFYRVTRNVSDYLRSDKVENLDLDTLLAKSYFYEEYSIITYRFIMSFETTAFETLKSSGLMSLVKKDLASSMLQTYKRLEAMQDTSNSYMKKKGDLMDDLILEEGIIDYDWDYINDLRLRKFIYFYASPNNYHEQMEGQCTDYILRTLSLF